MSCWLSTGYKVQFLSSTGAHLIEIVLKRPRQKLRWHLRLSRPQPKEWQRPKDPVQRAKVEERPHEYPNPKIHPTLCQTLFRHCRTTPISQCLRSDLLTSRITCNRNGGGWGCLNLRRGLRDEGQGIWADDRTCTSWASKILP